MLKLHLEYVARRKVSNLILIIENTHIELWGYSETEMCKNHHISVGQFLWMFFASPITRLIKLYLPEILSHDKFIAIGYLNLP